MQGVEPNTHPTEPFKAQNLNLTINRCGRVMDMRFHAVWGHCIAAGAIELHQYTAKYDDLRLEMACTTLGLFAVHTFNKCR